MMEELQEHRRKERDYTSLEDQIRCLQKRFSLLQGGEVCLSFYIIAIGRTTRNSS